MNSRGDWGENPFSRMGERVAVLETEVRIIVTRDMPQVRQDMADLRTWQEEQDSRLGALETSDKVRGGVLKAAGAAFTSLAPLWRVLTGVGMVGLAMASYLRPPV